jgi:putative membrane protein
MALHQGPLARRFGLADLLLHTTAGPVTPRVIQAGMDEARALFDNQAARARAARKRQTSEQWLAQVAPPLVEQTPPVEPVETREAAETPDLDIRDQRNSPDQRTSHPPQQEGPQRG